MITKFETLTLRQKEILELICLGLSNKEIMEECFISINTIKKHIQVLYETYGIANAQGANRTKLVLARLREKQLLKEGNYFAR